MELVSAAVEVKEEEEEEEESWLDRQADRQTDE